MLFPSEHLAYSPTALGLYDALSARCEVTLYAPTPRVFAPVDLGERTVRHFAYSTQRSSQLRALPALAWKKVVARNTPVSRLGRVDFTRYQAMRRAFRSIREEYDELIAFDPMFLFVALSEGRRAHFVSLEITDSELPLLEALDRSAIQSVMIQSEERYRYLFPAGDVRVFLVQNAPIFTGGFESQRTLNSLVLNGTALPWFGLEHCLRFIRACPEFMLTLKGAVQVRERRLIETSYRDLLDSRRLSIHETYLDSQEMLRFMGGFEAGFCFYDVSFPFIDTFNYRTAPSGKMFAYFAAGVPVVGNDIPGLKPIEEFQAGILIPDFEPATILSALRKIQADHASYRANCFRAAAHYSFDRSVAPFVGFVLGQERATAGAEGGPAGQEPARSERQVS